MTTVIFSSKNSVTTALEQAQQLELPSRDETLHRSPASQLFWLKNRELLQTAWQQWEQMSEQNNLTEWPNIFDEALSNAISQAWQTPETEHAVRDLWQEIVPGVYQCQFFAPAHLAKLREYLDRAADANIPTRAPYGIVLNRKGAMLDSRSEGYLAAPSFQQFYQAIMDQYMRPVARMLFPEIVGYDSQTFGFSIQYQAGMDTSLRLHTDASAVTMNINLNLADEHYTGSEVDFYDPTSGKVNRIRFEPGMALIHRGNIAHAAQPITQGTRTNFVFWLYGERGAIPPYSETLPVISANERWQTSQIAKDQFAPF